MTDLDALRGWPKPGKLNFRTEFYPEPDPEQFVSDKELQIDYWARVQHDPRWAHIKQWIEFFSPMETLVDVGCYDTQPIYWGEAERRICVDLQKFPPPREGMLVEKIQGDWLQVELSTTADLLLCLETIEHQTDDRVLQFTRKLLDSTRLLIVSLPYDWKPGGRHRQDHITWAKLQQLMHGLRPVKNLLAERQLLALYKGEVA